MLYLDHAATTAVHTEVQREMQPYFSQYYGNPSGIYEFAEDAREMLQRTRRKIAQSLHAVPEEIYFTSGGTEADNWALKGVAESLQNKGKHIITSQIEHHAVLRSCEYLERRGFEITYLSVDENGMISLEELMQSIRPDTILISIMFANNEIGTLQPIAEIGSIARKHHILFHTDAVQAYLHEKIDVENLQIDLLSASAHKFQGPKGVGFLYVRSGCPIEALLHGGSQEAGMRAGTENVPGIIGMGKAVSLQMDRIEENRQYVKKLRNYVVDRIQKEIPYVTFHGSMKKRLAGNINMHFSYIEGESLIILLDMEGICVSAGSACASREGVSHVLKAIHIPDNLARGTIRVTIGEENTMEEMDFFVDRLKVCVSNLREFSDEYAQKRLENSKRRV